MMIQIFKLIGMNCFYKTNERTIINPNQAEVMQLKDNPLGGDKPKIWIEFTIKGSRYYKSFKTMVEYKSFRYKSVPSLV